MIHIGNIVGTPLASRFLIFDGKTGEMKGEGALQDDSELANTLMSDHFFKFSFNCDRFVELNRYDYIEYDGLKYRLKEDVTPEERNLVHYVYDLQFFAPEMFFQDCIMFYTMQGYKETGWSLYGTANQFLTIACENINAQLPSDGAEWTIGVVEPEDIQLLEFDSKNVFDSLADIAELFDCEWYVDYQNKTINLVYLYERDDDRITLRRETNLNQVTYSKDSEKEQCTRLYAFGSTRNIPKNYRTPSGGETIDAIYQKKLRLPISTGDYIDIRPNMEAKDVVPLVKTFDHIYPKRIGEITSLEVEETKDKEKNPMFIYRFKDSGLNFSNKYKLPGESLMVHFESGWLQGRDFEVEYYEKSENNKYFEIIIITEGENYVSNGILKPRVGDKYVLYNFDISLVGDQYVGEAEIELEVEARKYLESLNVDTATYTCTMNPVYRFEHDLEMELGQRVRLVSNVIPGREKKSRVYGYRKMLATGLDEYIIGDVPDYKRIARLENKVKENKKITDVQYVEAMKVANESIKNVKALNYLRVALENETVIDKGLLLTTLIRLGAMMGDEWIEKAGINGSAVEPDDVVAYFGGSLEDAVLGLASIIFRMDGSGHLAKGNISWNALGDLLMLGKFESNKDGNRIVIDPDTRVIKMVSSDDKEVFVIEFEDEIYGGKRFLSPKLTLNNWMDNTKTAWVEINGYEARFYNEEGYETYIQPKQIGIFNPNNSNAPGFSASIGEDLNNKTVLMFNLSGLPTSKSSARFGAYTASISGNTVICLK